MMTWLILFVTESVMELMTGPVCASPVADYFYGFELVAQQLSRCVGHTERVLRGVKLGVLPEERTAYGDDVLSHTVYHALPFGDGFHLLLVGKVEDVLDGFLPVLGTLLDDACCDFFVVQTACDACASGVVAFLLGHDVVVKVNIERDFFVCCHDNDCFKESEYLFISYVLCCLSFRTHLDSITVQIKFEKTDICHAPSSISHQMELHKITVSQGVAVGSLNNGFGSWPDSGTTQQVII